MSEQPSGSMVFDTGVMVELVKGSKLALGLKGRIEGGAVLPHLGEINMAELSYLVCRREGWQKASRVTALIRDSGYFSIHPDSEFLERAGRLKCDRSISLVDCITIAMGETLSMPVLFARHERELDAERSKEPFKTDLKFLEDLE